MNIEHLPTAETKGADEDDSSSFRSILVLGVGNVLLHDEGVGVRIAEELDARYRMPPHVHVLDGGTAGMELLDPMRQCDCLIVADAINAALPPGSLLRYADGEIRAFFRTKLSNHQLGLSDLLALLALTNATPRRVVVVGVVPASLENGLGLTQPVTKAFPALLDMVLSELAAVGVKPEARVGTDARGGYWRRQSESFTPTCA